jgi:hypothetical protein
MPSTDPLTKKQEELIEELNIISSRLSLDYWNIKAQERDARTPILESLRRELIRGQVVSQYTLLDEHLGTKICHYLFPGKKFQRLWKTRRFERFNYFVLERMPLIQKFALVKDVYKVPKSIAETVQSVNSLRNALAHAFFPENLKDYRSKAHRSARKPVQATYKGVDIFTAAGLDRFLDDTFVLFDFFVWKIRRKKDPKQLLTVTSLDVPVS